jgi:hypothetical protein
MSKEITLTVFGVATRTGEEFVQLLQQALPSLLSAGIKFNARPAVTGGTQGDLMIAGLRDDIIVFDGSVEDGTGSNYRAMNMWPMSMEHFLVVSRTRLPENEVPPVPEASTLSYPGNS